MSDEIKEENTREIEENIQTAEPAEEAQPAEAPKKNGKVFFYIALACTVLSPVFFGLTFTPLGVYSLLASILFCLASLSFLGTQKKKENFNGVLILTIITYVLLGIILAFFVGGIIYVSAV